MKFLQVYLVLGVGVGRRPNRIMTILFEMSTPLSKTSGFTSNRCTYLRCRIINGFRLLVCYRVSRNRHFFFNFTRISNLIRGHKYWITLYCNKVGFLFSLFLLNLRLVSGLPLKYQIRGICFYKGLLHQQRP